VARRRDLLFSACAVPYRHNFMLSVREGWRHEDGGMESPFVSSWAHQSLCKGPPGDDRGRLFLYAAILYCTPPVQRVRTVQCHRCQPLIPDIPIPIPSPSLEGPGVDLEVFLS
jgi:hypothetical protein